MREYTSVLDDIPQPLDIKRRARAAWAYSLKGQEELASECGIPYNTLRGLLAATGTAPSVEQAWAIATACRVPRAFITDGFVNTRSDEERIHELLDSLASRLDINVNDLREVVDESRRSTSIHTAGADADLGDQAASGTHDEADATPEDQQSQLEETRRIADGADG